MSHILPCDDVKTKLTETYMTVHYIVASWGFMLMIHHEHVGNIFYEQLKELYLLTQILKIRLRWMGV